MYHFDSVLPEILPDTCTYDARRCLTLPLSTLYGTCPYGITYVLPSCAHAQRTTSDTIRERTNQVTLKTVSEKSKAKGKGKEKTRPPGRG